MNLTSRRFYDREVDRGNYFCYTLAIVYFLGYPQEEREFTQGEERLIHELVDHSG